MARSGGREDPGNVFGQLDDAEEGLDFHDLKETPPFDTSYFSILFTNPLFGAVDWGHTSEFRPVSKRPEGEWPFVVKASQDIGEITLHWEGEDYLFEDAWLVDEQNRETVKIEPGGSYAYTTKGAEAHFRIIIQ